MSLTNPQKAYVLSSREIAVPIDGSLELEKMLGEISNEEYMRLEEWERVAMNLDLSAWIEFAGTLPCAKIIGRSLAMQTGHQCLIPASYFGAIKRVAVPDLAQRLLLAYYEIRGYSTSPPVIRLTDEQQGIVDACFDKSVLVMAGPGTGKSTTIVEIMRRCVKEGKRALILTYTNSAKTTLRRKIAADPYLGGEYKDEPFANGNKVFKSVLLSSVDQLALAILAGPTQTRTYGATVDFEGKIASALNFVRNCKGKLNIFYENQTVPKFDIIIVDEAQMLSNDRADLVIEIKKKMTTSGINGQINCSLAVFSDPKQNIRQNSGQWLIDLYEQRTNSARGIDWQLHTLHNTYRFKSREMLEFVMHISRKRPALHAELKCHGDVMYSCAAARVRSIGEISAIAAEISMLYADTKSVGLLTPTYGRSNATSVQLNALILELRRIKVPVCLHGDDNFQANGVVVTTFNSCAGMEFMHVFIIGMAGYPKNYPQISHETGRALAFVANSRAKVSICYILDRPELGVDVDPSHVYAPDTGLTAYTVPDKYIPKIPLVWTTEIMMGERAEVYFENNDVNFNSFLVERKDIPNCKTTLYDLVTAFGRSPVLREADIVVEPNIPINPGIAHKKGISSGGRPVYTLEGKRLGDIPYKMTGPDENFMTLFPSETQKDRIDFYWYSNIRPENQGKDDVVNAERLREALMVLLDEDLKFCKAATKVPRGSEKVLSEAYSVIPDMTFTKGERQGYVLFTEKVANVLYTGAVLWLSSGSCPLMVQVDPRGSIYVFDNFHEIIGYHLDALRRIHIYNNTTIFKDNFFGIDACRRPGPNMYTIDTEYVNGKDIYEIGILCLFDPYLSFCAAIKHPNSKTRPDIERMERMHLTPKDFEKIAIDTDELALRILKSAARWKVPNLTMHYFSASNDINWLNGCVQVIDVAAFAATITPKKGTFNSDSRTANLDSLYGMYVGPNEQSGRHRAFPDAVMLGEIVCGMLREQ